MKRVAALEDEMDSGGADRLGSAQITKSGARTHSPPSVRDRHFEVRYAATALVEL